MKKLLLLLLLCISFTASAQNYNCFVPGVRQYFVNTDSDAYYKGGYLRGMRIDSVKQVGNTTVYYPFHSFRGPYGLEYPSLDTNGGSWLGKAVVQLQDGTFQFGNYWGDTVLIETQANVGDSWIFYNDSTTSYYTATVISIDTMRVLSYVDSVKTIRIDAYANGARNGGDIYNGMNIILSKAHGFVQVLDLYMFPMHPADSLNSSFYGGYPPYPYTFDYYTYLSFGGGSLGTDLRALLFDQVVFHNPTNMEINNYNVGDVFESSLQQGYGGNYYYFLDTITEKIVYADSIKYKFRQWTWEPNLVYNSIVYNVYSNIDSVTVDNSFYFDSTYIPEDFYSKHFACHYWPDDTTWCVKNIKYQTVGLLIGGNNGEYQVNDFEGCGENFIFKLGLGDFPGIGAIYQLMCLGGDFNDINTTQLLFVSKQGNSCGSYFDVGVKNVNVVNQKCQIYPNPVSDELYIKLPADHIFKITIINSVGQTLYSNPYGKNTEVINTQHLPTGIYIASVTDENGGSSKYKVVVQH